LIINDNATSTSGSANSFVDGPLRKIGNDAFVFPVGDTAIWARIGIDNSAGNVTTEFTAEYFSVSPPNFNTDLTLNNVSRLENWSLSRAINNDNVPVTLYWEDTARSAINSFSPDLVVARFNGTAFTSEGQGAIVAADPGNVTSFGLVTDFSELRFTFGSLAAGLNPLPIELLSFDATLIEDQVHLDWITLTEINNDFFTVERSKEGLIFEEVAIVPGAGNSNVQRIYSSIDHEPYQGISYYRLKQTDYNGDFSFSNIAIINNQKS